MGVNNREGSGQKSSRIQELSKTSQSRKYLTGDETVKETKVLLFGYEQRTFKLSSICHSVVFDG